MTAAPPLFKNRTFSRMFYAYAIAAFGEWIDMIAMMVLFNYVWHADPFVIALIPLMYAVPSILLSTFAGVLVDRMRKVPIMMTADSIRALLTLGLILAPTPYAALGLMLLRSVCSIFNMPAQQALIRNVVDEGNLLKASSLTQMVTHFAKIVGPLLGSALVSFVAPQVLLAINAGALVIAVLVLASVGRVPGDGASDRAGGAHKQSFAAAWREGFGIVLKARVLLASLIFFIVCMFALQMVDAQVGVLLRDLDPDNESLLGWCVAAVGIGTVVIGGWMSSRKTIRAFGWLLGSAAILIGASFGAMGQLGVWNLSVYWALAFGLVLGAGVGFGAITFSYVAQKSATPEAMGRVQGIISSLTSVVVIIAPLIGGMLVKQFGAPQAFAGAGLAMVALGVIGILFQRAIWGPPSDSLGASTEGSVAS